MPQIFSLLNLFDLGLFLFQDDLFEAVLMESHVVFFHLAEPIAIFAELFEFLLDGSLFETVESNLEDVKSLIFLKVFNMVVNH